MNIKNKIIGLVIDMTCDNYLIAMSNEVKDAIIEAYNKFDKSLTAVNIMSASQVSKLDTQWYDADEYYVVSDELYSEMLKLTRTFYENTNNDGVTVMHVDRFFREDFHENLDTL